MILLDILRNFDWTWIVTALVAALTYIIVGLEIQRRKLPPGPLPLPIIGNMLVFLGSTKINDYVSLCRKKYGDVFTVWIGRDPTVVICGWDKMKEGLVTMKTTMNGKRVRPVGEWLIQGHHDLVFSDYGPVWEVQRKILTLALRKYTSGDGLAILVNDVINQVVPLLLTQKGEFDPKDYIYFTIYNIIAQTAFAKRYSIEDEEFLALKESSDLMNDELNMGTILDVYPVLRYVPIVNRYEKIGKDLIKQFKTPIMNEYKTHKETYKTGTIRDFTDACIAAKEQAELEERDTAKYFTDGNMSNLIFDLFFAGTDTTRITLTWVILYLAHYTEIQDKVRAEVLENIAGDRIPLQEDKLKCPYTMAVITETLRTRPIISFSLEHKSLQDVNFAGYKIPNQTSVTFHFYSQHMDPEYFEDPEEFRPERFIKEDGSFEGNTSKITGYLPFGLGKRSCPGEKLALADLFLVLTGLVRKIRFDLPGGPRSGDLEPLNIFSVNAPKPFKLKVQKL